MAMEELPSAMVLPPIATDWVPKARAPSSGFVPPPMAIDCPAGLVRTLISEPTEPTEPTRAFSPIATLLAP